jgi:small-conductance mechanosensitive channel
LNERLLPDFKRLLDLQNQLQTYRLRGNNLADRINLSLTEIDGLRANLSQKLSFRELPYIWLNTEGILTFEESWDFAFKKESNLLYYYIKNNLFLILFLIFIGLMFNFIVKRIVHSIKSNASGFAYKTNPVFLYPTLTLVYFLVNLSQFVFLHSPFVFQGLLWLISWSIAILFIIKKVAPFNRLNSILFFFLLYPIVFFENLLLVPYPRESLVILLLSVSIIVFGILYWILRGRFLPGKALTRLVLILFLFSELGASMGIIYGRYNLSKILLISGYIGVMGSVFLFTMREIWYYFLEITHETEDRYFRSTFLVGLRNVGEKSKLLLNVLLYIGIIIVFTRSYYVYSVILEELSFVLAKERFIGKYSFRWEEILTFVGVIFITVVISKIISLLFDDKWSSVNLKSKKGGLQNWALVVKLMVFIAGIFIAFAAAGVPMDNIAIIIGSLGLGIGFGLQGIVSNLISGIIIAFERPFEINDQVEWNNTFGRITEIGIRSSKIANADGSEIVVPNSDLLNQKLINWTHSNNLRRLEIEIGLSYKADLGQIKLVLGEVIGKMKVVRNYPEPQILMHVFSTHSVTCRLLLWVDINDMLTGKSEVISAIHKEFTEQGIEIPFPQLDLHMDAEATPTKTD